MYFITPHMYFRVNLKMKKPTLFSCFAWTVFFKLRFTSCKAEQPLPGMELQEKEAQQRLKHRGPTVKRCLLILDLKSLRS